MKLKFEIIVEQDGDRLWGRCQALKGFHVDGATEEELLQNAVQALGAYIASLKAHDEPIPVGCVVREKPALGFFARHFSPPRILDVNVAVAA